MRRVWLAVAFAAGCGSAADSRLDAIEPAAVSALVATPSIIRGENLFADAHVDLEGVNPAKLDRAWRVRIGNVALGTVTWIDPRRIDVVIPSGVAPGTYDVTATSPSGTDLVLPGALTVTTEPLGLVLAIEDAPNGSGHPIGGTLAAGTAITAFATARDSAGVFVSNIAVDWAMTSTIGTLDAGPSSSTTLTATKVGTAKLTATRAAASLSAQSADLTVVAGPAMRLVIDDAPSGLGQPIGDRTGLTTDPSGGLSAFSTARDAFDNFAGDVAATWTLTGLVGSVPSVAASTALIDFATTGVGVLHATASFGSSQTGSLTVGGGHAAQLVVAPATLTISADAAPTTFTATATDADGNATTDLGTLTWSIGSGPITALGSTGTLDPQRAGTGTVAVASSYGPSAISGSIVITPGAVAQLALSPPNLTINADAAPITFTATGTDADGNATTNLGSLAWSIASGPITAIGSASGNFDPIRAGTGSILATSSLGPSQTASVTVTPGRTAALTVAPDTADLVAGGLPLGFTVTGADSDGNSTTDLGTIAWSRTGPFGALDAAGTLTPITPGSGSVRATSSYGAIDDSGVVRVRRAATLTAALAAPAAVSLGFTATITLTLTNTGESDATNVMPCALTSISNGGAVQITAGPSPASAAIAAGASAQFTWTVMGQTVGNLQLSSCGSGADSTTGAVTMSPNALASLVVRPPAQLVATLSIPTLIGFGEQFTVTMQVSNTGSGPATGVTPSVLTKMGTAAVALVTPASGGVSIAAGGSASFTWTYSDSTTGTVQFSGNASGTDMTSGTAISAPSAQSNLADIVEAHTVYINPFADGSRFGYVAGYHGEVLLGPNATGTEAIEFSADGSNRQTFSFRLPADVTGKKSLNTSSAPFPSIGATGCSPNTATCGPDNEDGRGSFTTVTIAGVEWVIAAGARTAGNNAHYVYMTKDTDSVFDFSYVDLSVVLPDHALAFSAITAINNIIYIGAAGDDAKRPRLIALQTTPTAPGLDATTADLTDLKVQGMPGIQPTNPAKIDALAAFASRLYLANDGVWARAAVPVPRDYAGNPSDWAMITPTALAYVQKPSRTSAKVADFEPSDRAVPQMAAFGGRLFVGRNTTTGPQLWSCNPSKGGDPAQCDPGDWSLVAPNTASCILFLCNGDTQLSQFDDGSLSSISMVVATPSHLYVGYDGPNGVTVFRTANPAAATQSDFEGAGGCNAAMHGTSCNGYGGAGFGSTAVKKIFDAKALTLTTTTSVWITAGSATIPVELVELP